MKILIDECVQREFQHSLFDHQCQIVPEASLAGKENGRLLCIAESRGFEVFLSTKASRTNNVLSAGQSQF
jgi:hypothetical protein